MKTSAIAALSISASKMKLKCENQCRSLRGNKNIRERKQQKLNKQKAAAKMIKTVSRKYHEDHKDKSSLSCLRMLKMMSGVYVEDLFMLFATGHNRSASSGRAASCRGLCGTVCHQK